MAVVATTESPVHGNRRCSRCVMDDSDPNLTFDHEGVCSSCRRFERVWPGVLRDCESGRLSRELARIRANGRRGRYDAVVGLSGGADSSYALYTAAKAGLRLLAVHVDSGWNTEVAVHNIACLTRTLNVDLETRVLNWESVRDLQRAFFKASLPNCDIPQDHAFRAEVMRAAAKWGIRWIITGHNRATESGLPSAWGYPNRDAVHLLDVHRQFGERSLGDYPVISPFRDVMWYPIIRGQERLPILNMVPYVKVEAMAELARETGFRPYGGKHHESVFTRYFQASYLPVKFGFDKRKPHWSGLIRSGQATREEAMEDLVREPWDDINVAREREFFLKKLAFSDSEWDAIMATPPALHRSFRTWDRSVARWRRVAQLLA